MSLNSNGDPQEDSCDITEIVRSPIPQFRDTLLGDFLPRYLRSRKRPAEDFTNSNESPKCRKLAKPKLVFRGSFQSARDAGQSAGKWLMVNLQDSRKNCTEQNRKVWKTDRVKKLVSQNFILWQVYQNNDYGKWYAQFYKPIEFPYVAIVDPRTGEKLKMWHQVDSETICERIDEFLLEFETLWVRNFETADSNEDHLLDEDKVDTSGEGEKE